MEEFFPRIHDCWIKAFLAILKEVYYFPDVSDTVDLELVDHARFFGVGERNDEAVESFFSCLDGYGQGTLDRPNFPIEAEFPHYDIPIYGSRILHLPSSCQNPNSNRQVEGGAALFNICRGE